MSGISRNKDFAVSVIDYSIKELAGIKIRTNMHTCQNDCQHLWQDTFFPVMDKLGLKNKAPAWGACCSYDAATGNFDYWALIQPLPHLQLPEQFASFTLPAGLYAQCQLTSISEIHTAYYYLYSRWLPSQLSYAILEDSVNFEYYPSEFAQTEHLSICIPVIKR